MVPISEIQEGQSVYAAPEEGQASDFGENEVGATILIGEASLVKLTVRHEDGSTEVIETTDEHPFHAVHTEEWTRADALVIGDLLSTMHGVAELLAVEYGAERVPVYNLSIPGSPTYYVGSHGLWVHNCKIVKHHLLPQRFREKFVRAGINIEEYVMKIPEDVHKQIHRGGQRGGSWNAMWESFWESYPNPAPGNPAKEIVERQSEAMKLIFGLAD